MSPAAWRAWRLTNPRSARWSIDVPIGVASLSLFYLDVVSDWLVTAIPYHTIPYHTIAYHSIA